MTGNPPHRRAMPRGREELLVGLVELNPPFFCTFRRLAMLAVVLCVGLLSSPARADEELGQQEQQAFRAAVQRVAPCVVRIETVGGIERTKGILFGSGPTTGLAVAPDGYILSSAFNFVHRPASVLVQLPDGSRKPARVVATDHNRMLTLLKIDPDRPLDVPEYCPAGELRVGQWTIAVGRTFDGNQPNMAVGVLSARERIWGKAIQTDAAVSPNNYGGPLIDVHGRVLGLMVPLSPQGKDELAGFEWYDSGIGFAIPAPGIQESLARLRLGKDLRPGLMGITFSDPALLLAQPVLGKCRPGSPAHQAGFKAGDRLVEIDGARIERAVQVKQEISRHYAGDKMHVVVTRGTERIERDLELAAKYEPYRRPFLGILPMRVVPKAKSDGVAVRWVYPDSPAAKAGIERGDVLVTFDNQPIPSHAAMEDRLADHQSEDKVILGVRRGDAKRNVELVLGALPESIPDEGLPPSASDKAGAEKPAEGKQPRVGTFSIKVTGLSNEVWAYVPQGYRPGVPHGLVLWFHGAEGVKEKEFLARWKPFCDQKNLIVLVPKAADPTQWQGQELVLIPGLLAHFTSGYTLDLARTAVCGQGKGIGMAYAAAMRHPKAVRGTALVAGGLPPWTRETDPAHPLAFYVAGVDKGEAAEASQQVIGQLRQHKYPVTARNLGPKPRDLTAEELAELARWVDALDRL